MSALAELVKQLFITGPRFRYVMSILSDMDDADPYVRKRAVERVVPMTTDLSRSEPELRSAIVQALAIMRRDPDEYVRHSVSHALAQVKHPAALTVLLSAAYDQEQRQRRLSITGLRRHAVREPAALLALAELTRDRDAAVASEARRALEDAKTASGMDWSMSSSSMAAIDQLAAEVTTIGSIHLRQTVIDELRREATPTDDRIARASGALRAFQRGSGPTPEAQRLVRDTLRAGPCPQEALMHRCTSRCSTLDERKILAAIQSLKDSGGIRLSPRGNWYLARFRSE